MTYADDVERHYFLDPMCSDEHYGYLMDEAHRSDLAAEARAELTDQEEGVILGGMTLPIATTLGVLTTQVASLLHENAEINERYEAMAVACENAERDLRYADRAAAVDKGGAVRIIDELCDERDRLRAELVAWVELRRVEGKKLQDINNIVSGVYDPSRKLLEIRRVLGLA